MLPAWLLLSLCAAALQLVSNSKTFYLVKEPRSWRQAMWYCQERYTDLADLQSMSSLASIKEVYSSLSSTEAWIGLFYDVHISGLRWVSGSVFTIPTWNMLPLPAFQDGVCATLYSYSLLPALGAASCTAQKPFICYYDPAIGHRISLVSTLEDLTTLPKEAEVNIGEQTFIRIKQTMSWRLALTYCRDQYTDLADLQRVIDKESKETLKSITNSIDAWIGLYYNTKTNNLTWSSDLGSSIPQWLQPMPMFGQGLCAGLRTFAEGPPQIYALLCHKMQPFICFYDRSIGHRKLVEVPPLTDTSSPTVTHPSKVTARTTTRPNTGTSTGSADVSHALVSATRILKQASHEPSVVSSGACGVHGLGACDTATPGPTTVGLTALQPQGTISVTPQATPAPSRGKTSVEDSTHIRDTTTATQAQHLSSPKHRESKEKSTAAESEHSLGILKADFTISTLWDPEEMKDQLLSENETDKVKIVRLKNDKQGQQTLTETRDPQNTVWGTRGAQWLRHCKEAL